MSIIDRVRFEDEDALRPLLVEALIRQGVRISRASEIADNVISKREEWWKAVQSCLNGETDKIWIAINARSDDVFLYAADRRLSTAEIEKYLRDLVFSDASGRLQPETEDPSGEYASQQNEVTLTRQSGTEKRVFAIACEAVSRALGRK